MSNNSMLDVTKGQEISSFGTTASEISLTQVKDKTKRTLKIVINGVVVDLLRCDSISINLDSDLVELNLMIQDNTKEESPQPVDPEAVNVISDKDEETIFEMAGDPLSSFIAKSPIRIHFDIKDRKIPQGPTKVVELQTIIYDIQATDSVATACAELIRKEQELVDQGADTLLEVFTPSFIFVSENSFKVTESVTIVPTL